MQFPADVILNWLSLYLWSFMRISGLLMVMVPFGSRAVPARVRLLLAVTISYTVVPMLPPVHGIELFSLRSFLIIAQQLLIGFAIGFITQLVMQTFVLAGQVIAMQTSLGFASMVDPTNGQNSPVVGQFYLLLATLVFLSLNGHLELIRLITMSFKTLPIGEIGFSSLDYKMIAIWFSQLFYAALAMTIAAIVAMLLINLAFGVMTRAAPQLNIFSIGFAVSMLFGLFILWLTIGNFLAHFEHQWRAGRTLACSLLKISC
ncbi:flagellar biosynthetic protein FliR [Celerinatantimonas diazotrophica]|uniref:Flagellar biosynthetic protein FliR n=1 Tax=Celerinatantimonas diazotrophica TaxID=412034 RepID=A0A4R1JM47_9GAMM|nr:flagellar biosynthetic protein FliR [Celerinatantimonas diazotrophica]TCK52123.1 flagellar biosynthetic protein FliR [Celerinatantimonas diazotrophica]CAG9296172.1 Flagellar biosynthetic protein FliR [Celerinatantimonas diazotrophica]